MVLDHDHRGAGSDLVFLHAAIGDRRLWDDQWPWVTSRYRALRCDFRGFGRSPQVSGPFSHARDVVDTLDSADVERTVLVAGSLGGRVALELAVARPELVAALVLVSPSLPGYEWSPAIRAFGAAEDKALERGDIESAVELNLRTWFDGPNRPWMAVDAGRRDEVAAMQRRAFELQLAGDDATEQLLVGDLPLGSPRSSRRRSFWSVSMTPRTSMPSVPCSPQNSRTLDTGRLPTPPTYRTTNVQSCSTRCSPTPSPGSRDGNAVPQRGPGPVLVATNSALLTMRSADETLPSLADQPNRYRRSPMARSIWSGTITFG